MAMSIKEQIADRIAENEHANAFAISDFLDIADYENVRKSLFRLEKAGCIRRVLPGIYDRMQYNNLLQEYVAPSMHQLAMAIARQFNWKIIPSGETALNQLGISTQVVSKWSFISDGPYRHFKIGRVEIEFKHRNNREMTGMSYKTAMIIQALKALGKENINESIIKKLNSRLSADEKRQLFEETRKTTLWIAQAIKRIVEQE